MSTFNRFATPRAYVDLISYLLSTGWRDLSNFSLRQDDSDTINIVNGVEANLYDMRPHDYLELNSNNQAFYIQIDTGVTLSSLTESSFIAILNHNFQEAQAVFKVEVASADDFAQISSDEIAFSSTGNAMQDTGANNAFSSLTAGQTIEISGASNSGNNGTKTIATKSDNNNITVSESLTTEGASQTIVIKANTITASATGNHTKLINATADSVADYIEPTENGWTLITFPKIENRSRYVRITIQDKDGSGSDFASNPIIGGVLYGEYIDFPVSPELGIKTSYAYDNTVLSSSTGGNTFANTTNFGAPLWGSTLPFMNTSSPHPSTQTYLKRHGRQKYSMNFSYISDTDLFTTNQFASVNDNATHFYDAETLHSNFYNRILGQHQPFLFSIDSTSTSEGDYGMYRMAKDSFTATQVANRTYNIGLDLVETW
jgi:hypothetical protein